MGKVAFQTKSGEQVSFKRKSRSSRKSRKSRKGRKSRTSRRTLSAYNLFVKNNIRKHMPAHPTLAQARRAMALVARDYAEQKGYRGSSKKK